MHFVLGGGVFKNWDNEAPSKNGKKGLFKKRR
jgi:hypothetical protein